MQFSHHPGRFNSILKNSRYKLQQLLNEDSRFIQRAIASDIKKKTTNHPKREHLVTLQQSRNRVSFALASDFHFRSLPILNLFLIGIKAGRYFCKTELDPEWINTTKKI